MVLCPAASMISRVVAPSHGQPGTERVAQPMPGQARNPRLRRPLARTRSECRTAPACDRRRPSAPPVGRCGQSVCDFSRGEVEPPKTKTTLVAIYQAYQSHFRDTKFARY
jgi:hypothetical protein